MANKSPSIWNRIHNRYKPEEASRGSFWVEDRTLYRNRSDGSSLVSPSKIDLGTYSSHWAACAAMIRLHNSRFRSLGEDRPEDLALEAVALGKLRAMGLVPVRDCMPNGWQE